MVKRIGNLWEKVISPENLREAARRACQGRRKIADVEKFLSDRDGNLERIRTMLIDGTYRTSDYRFFDRREGGKIRHIAALPFYPDRIVHWALILATQDVFMRTFVRRTYAAIPGRGTHDALTDLRRALRDRRFTHYLKVDVHHYFESIDKAVLMEKIKRRIKDRRVLDLFEHVIFDYPRDGIPIGNLTSQYLANLYLSDLDHQLAERYHATAFRYMDDIIVLGWSRSWLRRVRTFIGTELAEIGLEMNPNWRIASVEDGVDFVGYVVFRDFVLLRKRTKIRLKRKMRKLMKAEGEPSIPMRSCVASYHGILSWCDGTRLHRMYVDPVLDKWRKNYAEI